MVSLDVVIVSWNPGPILAQCLTALAHGAPSNVNMRTVVIDNASSDESLDALPHIGIPVTIVRNRVNRGFAAACNQGAACTGADYLLFLNPDVTVHPAALSTAIAYMQRQDSARVGVLGIQLLNPDGDASHGAAGQPVQNRAASGGVARSCASAPTSRQFVAGTLRLTRVSPALFPGFRLTHWDHGQTVPVGHVMGAFYLVRRSTFEELNGFDERFFVYYEDLDFSVRAQQAGWQVVYLADARATHQGGWIRGTGRALRMCHDWRSRTVYAHKHFGTTTAAALIAGSAVIEPLSALRRAILSRSLHPLSETARASAMLWKLALRRVNPPLRSRE